MKIPEAMSRAHREAPPMWAAPRGLLFALALLALVGAAGTFVSISTARNAQTTSRADALRNQQVIEQVAALELAGNRDVALHRDRNEELHADLCRLIFAAVSAAPSLRDEGIEACRPPLVTPALIAASPSPSPR